MNESFLLHGCSPYHPNSYWKNNLNSGIGYAVASVFPLMKKSGKSFALLNYLKFVSSKHGPCEIRLPAEAMKQCQSCSNPG